MKHFLNDIEIAPRNIFSFGLQSNFEGDPELLEIDADTLILPRESVEIIQNHILSVGIFEGIPYRIEMESGIKLDYFVDLTENAIYRDFEIEVKIKKRKGLDVFRERAKGTSFELMARKGVIFEYQNIPYIIVKDNKEELLLSLSISTFVLSKALIDSVKELQLAVSNLVEAVTPNASIPPLPPLGEIISLSIQVVGAIATTALYLVALMKLGQQMFEILFPKVRYYKGCSVKNLIELGCKYLGYSINSKLLNELSNIAIMPVPLTKGKKSIWQFLQNDLDFSFTKGHPTASDTTPTLGSLIDAVLLWFNAEVKVFNGVVQIERKNHWEHLADSILLPALNIQGKRQNEYTLNTSDIWKRCWLHYLVDFQDSSTVDFYDPTDIELNVEPTTVINEDLVSIKGLSEVNIPFALALRKNELTLIEKTAKALFTFFDKVTGVFGGGTSFATQITNRIGVTQLSNQFYSVTKIIYSVGGKQPIDYVAKIGADAIYNEYHLSNEIQNNDYKIFRDVPLRLNSQNFVDLLELNFAEIENEKVEILRIAYNDEQSKAIIDYKVRFNYAKGKVITTKIN